MKNKFEKVPSLIKWTGSKRLQAEIIQEFVPFDYNRYFEPFLGGASILFNNATKESYGNDVYSVVIDLWLMVKDSPQYIVEEYSKDWELLQIDFPNYFYTVRERFNVYRRPTDLLFLSRTAVNGI